MSVSDRRVSYGFLMRLTIGLILTAEHSDVPKFTEGSWQGSFAVNNERAVLASKQSRKSWYSQPPPPPKKKNTDM